MGAGAAAAATAAAGSAAQLARVSGKHFWKTRLFLAGGGPCATPCCGLQRLPLTFAPRRAAAAGVLGGGALRRGGRHVLHRALALALRAVQGAGRWAGLRMGQAGQGRNLLLTNGFGPGPTAPQPPLLASPAPPPPPPPWPPPLRAPPAGVAVGGLGLAGWALGTDPVGASWRPMAGLLLQAAFSAGACLATLAAWGVRGWRGLTLLSALAALAYLATWSYTTESPGWLLLRGRKARGRAGLRWAGLGWAGLGWAGWAASYLSPQLFASGALACLRVCQVVRQRPLPLGLPCPSPRPAPPLALRRARPPRRWRRLRLPTARARPSCRWPTPLPTSATRRAASATWQRTLSCGARRAGAGRVPPWAALEGVVAARARPLALLWLAPQPHCPLSLPAAGSGCFCLGAAGAPRGWPTTPRCCWPRAWAGGRPAGRGRWWRRC